MFASFEFTGWKITNRQKPETQFGVNLVPAQCELRDKCLKSNPSSSPSLPSIPVFLCGPAAPRYKVKYVDYRRALSRKRQNKHLRISTDSPQNYIFKLCSPGIFLYNRGPCISFCQLGSRTNIKLRNYPSLTWIFWIRNILGGEGKREVGIHGKQFWSHKPWFPASSDGPAEF